jgi:hypothetical protein
MYTWWNKTSTQQYFHSMLLNRLGRKATSAACSVVKLFFTRVGRPFQTGVPARVPRGRPLTHRMRTLFTSVLMNAYTSRLPRRSVLLTLKKTKRYFGGKKDVCGCGVMFLFFVQTVQIYSPVCVCVTVYACNLVCVTGIFMFNFWFIFSTTSKKNKLLTTTWPWCYLQPTPPIISSDTKS